MKRQIFASLVVLGFLAFKPIWAETYVYGTITGDTTWNLAGSPYIATDTVYVANGVKLTIEPGVTVRFATETSLICYGTLNAIGTPLGTITFTSSQTTPLAGDWKGIKLSGSGTDGSQISYCNIGYAKQAVYLENVSEIVIMNNFIHDNKGKNSNFLNGTGEIGVGVYLSHSISSIISNNVILNNMGGKGGPGYDWVQGGSGGIGCGIYLSSSRNTTISQNIISQTRGGEGGESIYGQWGHLGGSGGIGCGIYLSSSTNTTISQNIIFQTQGGDGGWGGSWNSGGFGGIGCGIYLSSSTNTTISQNIISQTQGGEGKQGSGFGSGGSGGIGCGIYLSSSTNTTISQNIIFQTQGGEGGKGGGDRNYPASGGSGGIGCGIYLSSSRNTTISQNTISSNIGGQGGASNSGSGGSGGIGTGIYLSNSTNNTILQNTISNNTGGNRGSPGPWGGYGSYGQGYGIYSISNSSSEIHCNNLSGNKNGDLTKGYGVYHDGSSGTISATYNWWGANSGPEHPITNPSGQGDKVSDWVDYWPWTAITLVNPNSGPIGTIVTIEGQGFTTQTQVFIDFGTHPTIAARESSITGTFSITFMVDTQPVCTKVITARNEYGKSATTLFKLMSGILGVSLSKEGPSFALSQSTITYTLYYKNTGTTVLSDVFLKDHLPNGAIQTFNLGLLNPNQEGSKTIKYFIQEQGSSTITNYATITGTLEVSCAEGVVTAYSSCSTHVTFIPEITNLTPTSGPIGTIITIQGQNFATSSSVSIDFGTHRTITTTLSDEHGSFSTTFIVDTQPSCTKIITARDSYGNYAITTFKIQGAFITKLLPTSCSVGSIITIEGVGFAGSSLSIDFGTMPTITTAYSSTNGTFSITFVVNTQPPCTKIITVSDFKETATTIFFLIPSPRITLLTPQSGPTGTIVTIAGSGFGPNTPITIAFGTNPNITNTLSSAIGSFLATFIVDTQPLCTKVITASGDSCIGEIFVTTTFKLIGIPGISLEKSGPEQALTLSTLTYTLLYQNTGQTELNDGVIEDTLPDGTTKSFLLPCLA
ncbi:MAG: right-handed parallel beta-helix repeat-containing protein, partial [bacterium]